MSLNRRMTARCVAALFTIAAVSFVALGAMAQDGKSPGADKIPKKVMDGLKAKFPKAEIQKWTKETEGGIVVYDIEFKQEGRKLEADIKEDGSIHNWERAITAKDLPVAAMKAVQKRYPGSKIGEVMAITEVKAGKETSGGYEVVLETAGKKTVEVTVTSNGKILEDAGTGK